ncbi:MAG TPA: hypothetical protein VFJ91_02125 [Gaiellaceae bacterium]|nr:hypothetical protein [Gaiellaceae bacterium]
MSETIRIERRFRGPLRSANGGYSSGLIASLLDAAAVEVTLRLPPPLETALAVERGDGLLRVLHGDALVAEARAAELDLAPPPAPSFADAERLSAARPPEEDHPFPGCFVCGTGREPGDALALRPAPLGDGRVAAPWRVPAELAGDERFAWAALDCPGGWAVQPDASRGISLLGRLTARVERPPRAAEECVVVGWPLADEGRRKHAGTALWSGGELLALGRAVWFEMGPEVRDPVESS